MLRQAANLCSCPRASAKLKKYHRNVSRPPFQNFTVKISPPQPNNMQLTCLTASIFHQEKKIEQHASQARATLQS